LGLLVNFMVRKKLKKYCPVLQTITGFQVRVWHPCDEITKTWRWL
jgi:hypothetical protein